MNKTTLWIIIIIPKNSQKDNKPAIGPNGFLFCTMKTKWKKM